MPPWPCCMAPVRRPATSESRRLCDDAVDGGEVGGASRNGGIGLLEGVRLPSCTPERIPCLRPKLIEAVDILSVDRRFQRTCPDPENADPGVNQQIGCLHRGLWARVPGDVVRTIEPELNVPSHRPQHGCHVKGLQASESTYTRCRSRREACKENRVPPVGCP